MVNSNPLKFESLEERMLYYRKRPEQSIQKNSYVLVMIDGRSFSQKIKKKFKRPFDDTFIQLMNETAEYLCSQVQGAKFAYVQSDEISMFMTDADAPESTLFYDGRLVKLLSIIPAIATSFFTKRMIELSIPEDGISAEDMRQIVTDANLYQFDCKVWDVPTLNDVFGWYLYRQNDCIKNSKGQAAQTYISHKQLMGKTSDEQIEMLKEIHNIDWNTAYDDGKKFGRYIYKEKEMHSREFKGESIEYERSVWRAHLGVQLNNEVGKKWFYDTLFEKSGISEDNSITGEQSVRILKDISAHLSQVRENLRLLNSLPDNEEYEQFVENSFKSISNIITNIKARCIDD